jgi:hypothetical protein
MPVPVNNPPAPSVPLVVYQPASQPPANVVVVNNPGQPCAPEPQPVYQQAQQYIASPVQQIYTPTSPGPDVPQPFAPADPDPNRVYWFRKHGGQYVTLTRYAIDQMNVVWYCKTDGSWYAVHV